MHVEIKTLLRRQQPKDLLRRKGVQITKAGGGLLRGRYVGEKNNVFGTDVQQVLQRLSRLETMRSVCIPKSCDAMTERAEKRGVL